MKKIVEYKTGTLISAQEYEEWKSNYTPGTDIPDQIYQYMYEVILPRISEYSDKLLSSIK